MQKLYSPKTSDEEDTNSDTSLNDDDDDDDDKSRPNTGLSIFFNDFCSFKKKMKIGILFSPGGSV